MVIDAHEKRSVAIFDVSGAYLNADMPHDKFVLIKFEEQFVDTMCTMDPTLKQDVRYEGGKKVTCASSRPSMDA